MHFRYYQQNVGLQGDREQVLTGLHKGLVAARGRYEKCNRGPWNGVDTGSSGHFVN